MKNKYSFFLLAFVSLFFFQCQKNLSYTGTPDPGVSVNPDPVTTNIQGMVYDENDKAADGVMITAGSSLAMTDANGFFHISKAQLDKNTTLVTAKKDGYFKAYRVFAATSGCNQVVIKLIKRNAAGTISSAPGGEVDLANGSKIMLPANGVVNASSGSEYSGDIKVYAQYINPRSNDISQIVPGSFVANDKDGKRVLLSSYGMLAVELESSAGEKLQIKSGSSATLTIPIASATNPAPASIPLWYLDEKTGIWQEEGTATKNGNNYIGVVKHFSFWNTDYSLQAVNLSLTLKTPDDLPLVNATVRVTASADSVISTYGWTDSLGQVRGLVPANENLKVEVIDRCGDAVYSQAIAPLISDDDLGVITISGNNSHLITLTGTLTNCSGGAVQNGYALINFDGSSRYVATDATGKFTTNYVTCNSVAATATVLGVNEDDQQQGQEVTVTITSPVTNAGSISACGISSAQYINYSVDGISYSLTNPNSDSLVTDSSFIGYTIGTYTTIIGYDKTNQNNRLSFGADSVSAAGTYPLINLTVRNYGYITEVQPFNIVFTNYPNVGGFYEGSFSGSFTDSSSTSHSISAAFRMRRSY